MGENRKLIVFPLDEVNEMVRGKGVILQRYKDGGLCDARVFYKAQGLTWLDGANRTFTLDWSELRDWIAARMTPSQIAAAQKLAQEWTPK